MERIKLSTTEKIVIRHLSHGNQNCPEDMPIGRFSAACHSLQDKGLIIGAYVEGGNAQAAKLSIYGWQYIDEYPSLRNPFNWALFWKIVGIGATVVGTLATILACKVISNAI